MAYFWSSLGGLSWICEGKFTLASFCIQRSIIDGINLLFMCVFYLLMLIGLGRKHHASGISRKDRVLVVASICCFITSMMYFINLLYNFIDQNEKSDYLSWVASTIKGLVWTSLAVSLLTQRSKSIICLNTVWWVCLCALLSAMNIEILLRVHTIPVFNLLPWLVSFLLLFCALRNHGYFISKQSQSNTMFEPLLCETEKVETSQTGLSQANCFSRFTFSWINPLLSLGYKKPLALKDIPSLPCEDKANFSFQKFAHTWDSFLSENGSNSPKNQVIWTMLRVFTKENICISINALAKSISAALSPLIVYAFVNYASRSEDNLCEGLAILGWLVLAKLVESVCERHWYFDSRRSGMRMRLALMVAVYDKLLRLSSLGRRRHSTGEIVNYIAVDAYRMGEFLWWFHTGWSLTLQIFLSIVVLFWVVGLGALPALVILLIFAFFFNLPYSKKIKNCQSQILISQDQRLRSTSEILNSIKIIKLQSWEDKFMSMVESLRDSEFKWLAETQFTRAFGTVVFVLSPTVICAVVLLGCTLFKTAPLNAVTIFTVLAALRTMAEPVRFIPEAISVVAQVGVSLDRLNTFLLDDELKTREKGSISISKSDNCIEIEAGNFSWDEELVTLTLRDINLSISRGQKVAVCGPVGAGKSSLLHAILGEMPKISGTVSLNGAVAYVSQTSWIQSGTIRDNILFGKSMEENRYENAIKACALDKDINGFSHGDLTEIGQRGLNLSGGQKQRVQLARAVYNDADLYLLDDPFSAVDAHTASVLFHDCVMSALREKTVILVTHQVEFLTEVDKILVIEGGCISQAGSHEELLTSGATFEQLVNAHRDAITVLDIRQSLEECQEVDRANNEKQHHVCEPSKKNNDGEICETSFEGQQLTQEEQRELGSAGWKLFLDYVIISNGMLLMCLSFIALIGFAVFLTASSYWLAIASEISSISSIMLVGVYTAMAFCSATFAYVRAVFMAHLGLKASKAFFSGFTSAIFNAPMSFFDSTPVGRILTRASSDLAILDFDIPFAIIFTVQSGIELITGIGIISSITWEVLIVAILVAVVGNYIKVYYETSARELVRINGTTKAPVVNYATETSAGVVTIRAFNMVDRFFQTFLRLVDTDAALFLHTNAALEWLLARTEILQNLIFFTAASLFVFLPKGSIAPGLVGLSLSYSLSLTKTLLYYTKWSCNLSNFIISVERIKQFMQIPQEPLKIMEDKRPPPSWPSKGRIEFQALKVRYRPNTPFVLDGITCTFKEGTRVGVVGRTGSGKTTLLSALFRLVEPTSGTILIDGLNICSIGLKDLRMKLSIIPQEPILFRGSIRTNLDPLDQFSDDEIWKVLEMCQLKEAITGLPYLLDSSVSSEGENWSMGQRQLFCLGRVLLKRNRILVLDEATASIDSATDAILQRIIRQEFSECTVITVAHRVPTVIDSDMVTVLSYGKLVEYDEPSKLMESNSSFSKLVAEYWSSCRRKSL
ncbi:ABC transporter C family member 8-like [Abrus precatorius]|uniref:ABC-type xenobiotic transporter n=1 Tax=Abrus precatorius TaxID=3816 RepID=A0A8B8JWK2_ABRPR|nr:ABC transporter C family member 8-like [Abrus precatorius]